jgi:hypothetical protein
MWKYEIAYPHYFLEVFDFKDFIKIIHFLSFENYKGETKEAIFTKHYLGLSLHLYNLDLKIL